MNFGSLARRLGQMAAENSPAILTALGVTGTLATAYLAGKASFKSALIIDQVENDLAKDTTADYSFEFEDKFKLVWKEYIPAAGVAALTVAAIISSNRIGTRRAAAVASAYAVAEKGFEEYRKKISEKIGKNKEREVRDEVAHERVRANPKAPNASWRRTPTGDDKNCYDMFSDRRFFSTTSHIDRAVNLFNQQVLHDGYASLSDFYRMLEMNDTPWSDMMGWNTDNLMEINITTTIVDDEPCFALVFVNMPKFEYKNFH